MFLKSQTCDSASLARLFNAPFLCRELAVLTHNISQVVRCFEELDRGSGIIVKECGCGRTCHINQRH
jgi:hypothetical protein